MDAKGSGSGMTVEIEIPEQKTFWLYFEESKTVAKTSYVEKVLLLKNGREEGWDCFGKWCV